MLRDRVSLVALMLMMHRHAALGDARDRGRARADASSRTFSTMASMEDDEIDEWLDSDSDGAGEEQQAAPAPAASSSTVMTPPADAGDGTTPSEATTPERADAAPTTAAPSSPDHEAPPANPMSPPDAPVVAAEVSTDATPAEAPPPPRDDADHDRATTPPEPPAPSPVATRVEPESAPADEMQTLSLSPGASPVALNAPRAPFDATRLDLNSAPEPEEPELEPGTELDEPEPDASPSPSRSASASTAPSPPAAPTAHAPPPVVSAMSAEPTPPGADATRPVSDPDRDADPNRNPNPNPDLDLDLDLDDAPAGLSVLGGWALGGFGAATRLARDSLRAVASSDLADKTARAARGIRREIVDLSKHVAGDDLAVASSNPAGDAPRADGVSSGPSPESEPETAQSLWRAFGHLARDTARAFESAATAAATNPDVASAAQASARVVSGFARRVEEGAFRLLRVHGADEDAAAEDASALERALVACGCASTLDELERLDAETARGGAEAADVHASSAEAAANAAEAERLLDLEDPDADDGGDDRAGGAPCPGEDALELTRAMRDEAIVAAKEFAAAAIADAESRAAISASNAGASSSPEHSDATALEAVLAPIRAEAATRVAEMVAAIVAHLLDVAASLGPSPSSSEPWPPPTSIEITARDVARARARAVRRRVAAALDDAEAVVDAYAEARVAVADAAASVGAADAAKASRVKNDAARGADAAKATARGYASDAARCLASIVAATAATAVAAKGEGVAATVAVQE